MVQYALEFRGFVGFQALSPNPLYLDKKIDEDAAATFDIIKSLWQNPHSRSPRSSEDRASASEAGSPGSSPGGGIFIPIHAAPGGSMLWECVYIAGFQPLFHGLMRVYHVKSRRIKVLTTRLHHQPHLLSNPKPRVLLRFRSRAQHLY